MDENFVQLNSGELSNKIVDLEKHLHQEQTSLQQRLNKIQLLREGVNALKQFLNSGKVDV